MIVVAASFYLVAVDFLTFFFGLLSLTSIDVPSNAETLRKCNFLFEVFAIDTVVEPEIVVFSCIEAIDWSFNNIYFYLEGFIFITIYIDLCIFISDKF